MIKSVHLTRFKKYKDHLFEIEPLGVSLLVGGNNAGKSTLIQALSVWEFCKVILLHEKGRDSFNKSSVGKGEGFGMSAEEFMPIAVPSLNHLWTNLKTQLSLDEKKRWPDGFPGYIMRIRCTWDYDNQTNKTLEIGLSLVNDRLFIRVTDSNLIDDDYIPTIVYLPTFAGVLPKENKVTLAERRAVLGRGMAGSIIRNMIYDLYITDIELKKEFADSSGRLRGPKKEEYEEKSPLLRLQRNLRNTFKSELEIMPFNEDFHTVIRINERKVLKNENGEYEVLPKSKYSPRDIITQGSGYLQWLSIFSILYSSNIDVLLLDEPDAHLHATLQSELLNELLLYLDSRDENRNKQILISTHSVEMIKNAPLSIIYSMEKGEYLKEEESRVAALSGIGSEYFPKIDLLKKYKKLIFVENNSDKKVLEQLGEKCGLLLPTDAVYWANTYSHADRVKIFNSLHAIIPELKCVSLRDRDMDNIKHVAKDLTYKGISSVPENMICLQWRRKNIESYLLCPKAIALASGQSVDTIINHFAKWFGISIEADGYINSDAPEAILLTDGKHYYTCKDHGIEKIFHCDKYKVIKYMNKNQVCEDIMTFIKRVNKLFNIDTASEAEEQ